MSETNAEKAAAFRAKMATPLAPGTIPVEEVGPLVDVKVDLTPEPKVPWTERMKKKFGSGEETVKQVVKKASGKKPDNIIVTVLPSMLSMFVATYAADLYIDPYKPCAPTKHECELVFTPILETIGRHLEFYGKASQDVIDISNAIIYAIMFGIRSTITYVQIKREVEQSNVTAVKRNDDTRYDNGYRGEQLHFPAGATGGYPNAGNGPIGNSPNVGHAQNGESVDTSLANGNSEGGLSDADRISGMLKRDVEGRIRLGLLPPRE
jgi:hypothetical protein